MFQTDLGKRSIRKRYAVTYIMGLLLVFVYVCVHAAVRSRACVYLHVHTYAFQCVSACVYS